MVRRCSSNRPPSVPRTTTDTLSLGGDRRRTARFARLSSFTVTDFVAATDRRPDDRPSRCFDRSRRTSKVHGPGQVIDKRIPRRIKRASVTVRAANAAPATRGAAVPAKPAGAPAFVPREPGDAGEEPGPGGTGGGSEDGMGGGSDGRGGAVDGIACQAGPASMTVLFVMRVTTEPSGFIV